MLSHDVVNANATLFQSSIAMQKKLLSRFQHNNIRLLGYSVCARTITISLSHRNDISSPRVFQMFSVTILAKEMNEQRSGVCRGSITLRPLRAQISNSLGPRLDGVDGMLSTSALAKGRLGRWTNYSSPVALPPALSRWHD